MRTWHMIVAAMAWAMPGDSSAEILALCGASDGYAYYLPKNLSKPDDAGWTDDAISTGSFQLIRAGEDFDIIYTDTTGHTLSAKGDGGSISGIVTEDGDVVVQVIYERVIEVYVFWLSLADPVATFSSAKFGTIFPKHAVMAAKCYVPKS